MLRNGGESGDGAEDGGQRFFGEGVRDPERQALFGMRTNKTKLRGPTIAFNQRASSVASFGEMAADRPVGQTHW
jgi:hypothetical protein